MILKRKYRIAGDIRTLSKFMSMCSEHVPEVFIRRVTPDASDEHYYVVVEGTQQVHDTLRVVYRDYVLMASD